MTLIQAAFNLSLFVCHHDDIIRRTSYVFDKDYIEDEEPFVLEKEGIIRVISYSVIFVVSLLGNVVVILTLSLNKRMKTVTNVFLLNLAVSDLLIVLFCMPFTLVGSLLRNFIFGEVMCKLIPFAQAISVSVSVWTLVAISMERFFAICRPLRSRHWQTVSHAYKVIWIIWIMSALHTLPILILSKLLPSVTHRGKFRCREVWSSFASELGYNIYLDFSLLVVPLIIMSVVYSLLMRTMCTGLNAHGQEIECRQHIFHRSQNIQLENSESFTSLEFASSSSLSNNHLGRNSRLQSRACRTLLVQTNYGKSRRAKRKVILMLSIVVVTFFICWTPLYVAYTWHIYSPTTMNQYIGSTEFSVLQLIAFASSCSNPITYCFLHQKFREVFSSVIKRRQKRRWQSTRENQNRSINMTSACSLKTLSIQLELPNMEI